METLESLDIVVVVFATNHLDIKTMHYYGRNLTEEQLSEDVHQSAIAEYGIDAVEGFEVLCVSR